MIDIRLNPGNWDLDLEGGDLVLIQEHEETVQHIRQRLLMFQGEWFLDLEDGLPWLEEILGKPREMAMVEALLKERIQGSPGVEELTAFGLEEVPGAERTVRVDFTVRLADGEILQLNLEIG